MVKFWSASSEHKPEPTCDMQAYRCIDLVLGLDMIILDLVDIHEQVIIADIILFQTKLSSLPSHWQRFIASVWSSHIKDRDT